MTDTGMTLEGLLKDKQHYDACMDEIHTTTRRYLAVVDDASLSRLAAIAEDSGHAAKKQFGKDNAKRFAESLISHINQLEHWHEDGPGGSTPAIAFTADGIYDLFDSRIPDLPKLSISTDVQCGAYALGMFGRQAAAWCKFEGDCDMQSFNTEAYVAFRIAQIYLITGYDPTVGNFLWAAAIAAHEYSERKRSRICRYGSRWIKR